MFARLATAARCFASLPHLAASARPLVPPSALAAAPSLFAARAAPFRAFRRGNDEWHATTILCVRKGGKVVMIGDGQVSKGNMVVKPNARKVRRLRDGIVGGFAGATADALTLFERLETKLDEHGGQLLRSAVEMSKNWRMDKYLRNLEAVMIVADKDISLELTGHGDVIEPFDNLLAVGSGGDFALAAARALMDTDLDAEEIARRSMAIAADLCVYTNHTTVTEVIEYDEPAAAADAADGAGASPAADPDACSQ